MNRATAVVSVIIANIIFLVPTAANDDGPSGWRISFNYVTEGQGTVVWQSGIEPNIVTHREHRSHFADFSGTYLISANGTVIRGDSSGSENILWMVQSENWLCGVGDNLQKVSSEIGTQSSTTLTGPGSGELIGVYLRPNIETGIHDVEADLRVSIHGTHTWWNDSYDGGTCTPVYDSGTESFGDCPECFRFQSLRATATDNTNLIFQSSGSEDAGCAIVDHAFADTRCVGPITRTWSVTAERFAAPSIHGVELTQAIQVYQTVEDLQAQLVKNNGNPPIPIVANKPLAIRVALEQPAETVKAKIEALWNGTSLGTEPLTQPADCAPPNTRMVDDTFSSLDAMDDCQTADFMVGSRLESGNQPLVTTGNNQLVVRLYSDDPTIGVELLEEYELSINAHESDTLMLGAVNICAERIGSLWQCLATPVRDLRDGTAHMSKFFPTDEVLVVPTGHQVRLEVIDDSMAPDPEEPDGDQWDCYDSQGKKILEGVSKDDHPSQETVDMSDWLDGPAAKCEKDIWWHVALVRIMRLYTDADSLLDASGIRKYYFGLVKPIHLLAADAWGMAWSFHAELDGQLVSNERIAAAIANTTGPTGDGTVLSKTNVRSTVAHEAGHLLGQDDMHEDSKTAKPKCEAWDATQNPPELYLFSDYEGVVKREVPFDVANSTAFPPYTLRDIMSYCDDFGWVSPLRYQEFFDVLKSTANESSKVDNGLMAATDKSGSAQAPLGIAGKFWLVSGLVDENSAFLDTVFTVDAVGPSNVGDGSHQILILDEAGVLLFERKFTPLTPFLYPTDRAGELPVLPLPFSQLIPVQPSAAKITVRDASGALLVEKSLGGLEPDVAFVYPAGGEQVAGEQELMWTATDDDSELSDLVYWVQYSSDAGASWMTLAQSLQDTSLVVDFDDLPGAPGTAMIKILASDRVNTGSAVSNTFTVNKKLPSADILLPENGRVTPIGGNVFFEGYGYDHDDGLLPGETHRWSSDIDGDIGIGHKVSSSALSEGQHRIRLSVFDSDNNTAFAEVQVFVGDFADEDGDGVPDDVDQCPGTPAGEEVNSDGCSSSQLDDDGDGVSDLDDQCPATPAGEAVDGNGCSASQRDSDGDGVNDANDQCPGTPSGTAVDNNGCATSHPTPSSSSGGGGGGFSVEWVFFLWYLALLQSRNRFRLQKTAERIP